MAIIDDFKTRFPEFQTSDVDTYLPALINVYKFYYDRNYECARHIEIILQLLAHLLVDTLNGSTTPMREEQQKTVGNVSATYNGSVPHKSASRLWFSATKYGMHYIALTAHDHGGLFV